MQVLPVNVFKTGWHDRKYRQQSVANPFRNLTADEEQKMRQMQPAFQEIGLQIADTLGEMKGAVMKVGQNRLTIQRYFPT